MYNRGNKIIIDAYNVCAVNPELSQPFWKTPRGEPCQSLSFSDFFYM